MQYTSFYWEHGAALLTPVNIGQVIRVINAASLYRDANQNESIYIKQLNFAASQFDLTAARSRGAENLWCGLCETLDNPRTSRNLTMTAVGGNDLTNPGGLFAFVTSGGQWDGKVLMPEQFEFRIWGGQETVFAAGDIFYFVLSLGYELEKDGNHGY